MIETTYSMAEAAELTNFPGGRNKLLKWMRTHGFLSENNQPDSRLNKHGWFKVFDKTINKWGFHQIYGVPTLTSRGLSFFETIIRIYFVDQDMERFNGVLEQLFPKNVSELNNLSGDTAIVKTPTKQINYGEY